MIPSKYLIHSLVFNLSVPNSEMAITLQKRIRVLAEGAVSDIIEQAVAQYEQGDRVIRIDQLELDLGTVGVDSLELDIQEQLREKLTDRLAEKIPYPRQDSSAQSSDLQASSPPIPTGFLNSETSNQQPPLEGIEQLPLAVALLEQLGYFLVTGQVPWNADVEAFRNFDDMVMNLITTSGEPLAQLLQSTLPLANPRQRLIFNLQEATLNRLLQEYLGISRQELETVQMAIAQIYEQLVRLGIQRHQKSFHFEALLRQVPDFLSPEPASLFRRWLEWEIHPAVFSSKEQWNSFRETVMAETPKPLTNQLIGLRKLLAEQLQVIEKQFPNSQSPTSQALDDINATDSIQEEAALKEENYWFIHNSGLILLWPYLQRYLATLNLVRDNQFISPIHQLQAVHELEFLVRGGEKYREYDLLLNKVLCGLPLAVAIDPEVEVIPLAEREAEQLLQSAINNWKIIGNTSIIGFRQLFLKCDGKLLQRENGWTLIVDHQGYDILLEKLPYPIYVVKLPWMEQPIYLEW